MAQDDFKRIISTRNAALKNFLGSEDNALKFMSAVMHSIQKTPKLLQCDQESLLGAFMECATVNLYPGGPSGECYVLPYKTKYGMKAQFQLGYKGVRTIGYRAGVLRLGAEVVYDNDQFQRFLGTNPRIEHIPASGDRGEPVGAYAWAEVTKGNTISEYMTKDQIMAIKAMSPGGNTDYSPWSGKNDPQLWMWKKTVFKQLGKMLPSDDKGARAIMLDNISERGGYIESETEVVEVPFRKSPEQKINEVKDKKEELRKKKAAVTNENNE